MATVASVREDVVSFSSGSDPIASIEQGILERIGAERFDLWFDRKTQLSLRDGVLQINACNAFAANWIRAKFADEARAAAQAVLAQEIQVNVAVSQDAAVVHESTAHKIPAATVASPTLAVAAAPKARMSHAGAVLNPKYLLEEFVVGPSNQMAYHAAVKVAENPGKQFNPLFIHGSCGLGKTHLLQGICQRFMRQHPDKKFLYMTGEQFTNEFLEAIRNHKTDAFRKRIRNADLLVIDDVHFLANKKATQEEFLHTFNQIDAGGRQVVLASDCAPKQIEAMAESLTSRFVSGMVLRVDAPDLPTRLEILRRKAVKAGYDLSDAVLMHIAQSVTGSVRELEGMLLQVSAGMTLLPGASGDVAATVVAGLRERNVAGRSPVSVDRIVNVVSDHFGVAPAALLGSSREKTASLARAVAMYLARQHTGMSFPEIGSAMGRKNHSTVIAACQRVELLLASGELCMWLLPTGPRHQSMPDIVHELEDRMRKSR